MFSLQQCDLVPREGKVAGLANDLLVDWKKSLCSQKQLKDGMKVVGCRSNTLASSWPRVHIRDSRHERR